MGAVGQICIFFVGVNIKNIFKNQHQVSRTITGNEKFGATTDSMSAVDIPS